MRCASCGTEHDEAARFCGTCGAPLNSACHACGAPIAPGLRFCTACGAAQDGSAPDPAAGEPIAERRRISVLFLDLEDFTSLAERLDPEEVRAIQSRYFETARSMIARYGGTVEKYIGDAVVAIWGAPIAHEDDATRAVQAAIELVDAIGQLGGATGRERLTGRASVTTGEAAVTLDAVGQGIVTGDLVNVAARLQGLASSGGVLVDDVSRRLAPHAADYETMGPLELKGREVPVAAHRARPSSGTRPATRGMHGGPFVGRDRELQELLDLHDGVVRDARCRLVSISGIAGIGKSRLVWELSRRLDARAGLTAWHGGRSPAYGEGITFAAVAEMVRHRIGAPPGTAPELEQRQLAASLVEIVRDRTERAWLEPRLAALLGHARLDAWERDELFAAWRRYFERVAETAPSVLVFEDLQWADAALLDFVEHLATWARHHPILLLAVTRPELADHRPGWGATVSRFTSLHLEGLPAEDMRELLRLRAPQLRADAVERIMEHAGGVPLYAVEVARSLADADPDGAEGPGDRRAVARRGGSSGRLVAVPESLHGMIAARIDALPPPERRLLLAAAVLGHRFSLEALAAVGAEVASLRSRVGSLVDRELLSVEDADGDPARAEVSFVQDVVRDVAYRTISRRGRRTLHLAAAAWLEGKTGEEAIEPLAVHLAAAHDLAPDHPDAPRVARRTVSALRRAAAAAMTRHLPGRALGHLEQAVRLTDQPDQRAIALDEAAGAATAAGRLELAEAHLRELANVHLEADRRREAARTRARLAGVLLTAQRNESAVRELESALRAMRRVDRDAPGVELTAQLARARMLIGDDRGGLRWAERGLVAASRLGLDALAADLLVTRGTARVNTGDEAGLDDLRQAIADAARIGSLRTELRARNNLAWLLVADDPRTTLDTAREAVSIATSMGVGDLAAQLAEVACAAALETGDWTWAIDTAGDLLHPGTPLANRLNLAATLGTLRALRGEPEPLAELDEMVASAGDIDDQVTGGIELARGWAALVTGDLEAATVAADRAAAALLGIERLHALTLAARARLWSMDADGARRALGAMEGALPPGQAAAAHLASVRAGVEAVSNPGAATIAYRTAAAAWLERGLDGNLAVFHVDEARMLGRPLGRRAKALIERLGAEGLRRLVPDGGNAAG